MKWYQYLQVGAFVAGWLSKSISDGIISEEEIKKLVLGLFEQLDVKDIKIVK